MSAIVIVLPVLRIERFDAERGRELARQAHELAVVRRAMGEPPRSLPCLRVDNTREIDDIDREIFADLEELEHR